MPKKFVSINLIKDQKSDLVERIINWSLGVGRILIIVTELIALGAFLWRFGLDQQLVDLHTEIKQKQAIVSAFKKNEEEYRNLQDRLAISSNFTQTSAKRVQVYKDILALTASGIIFSKISLDSNRLVIEINADSVSSLSNFTNSLKAYPEIEAVSIDKIETKTSSAVIVVGISADLKPIPNEYEANN
ncbi:MAG: hypothetical protein UR81_C0030G0006 [Candidatus Levybacteria bacterium GW2011_GWB1_35_5]|nr:MAG: hypothetical protein UR81_C0030G0006 [Candidatus Levybacteria bacterium GW2011_GWB1_35_5]